MSNKFSPIFVVFAGFFIACLMISNVIAGKLFALGHWALPAGAIIFPITYLFGDVLTEVWGFGPTRFVIWLGFAANIFMSVVFLVVIALPHPGFWTGQSAYAIVLGMTPRLVIASTLAYWCGSFINSFVMSRLKVLTEGKWLWTRTIASTSCGELIDTCIFITISFYGLVPNAVVIQMIILQYIWKVAYEAIATPLTYAIIGWIKKVDSSDVYDKHINYSPFKLGVN